jgi:hypothetical protein
MLDASYQTSESQISKENFENRIVTIFLQVVCASLTISTLVKRNSEIRNPKSEIRNWFVCCLNKFYGQAKGLISSGQLSTLLHLHIHPINLVVYEESHWQN